MKRKHVLLLVAILVFSYLAGYAGLRATHAIKHMSPVYYDGTTGRKWGHLVVTESRNGVVKVVAVIYTPVMWLEQSCHYCLD